MTQSSDEGHRAGVSGPLWYASTDWKSCIEELRFLAVVQLAQYVAFWLDHIRAWAGLYHR